MAKEPEKASKSRISNIMDVLRGNIDFGKSGPKTKTKSQGRAQLISSDMQSKILGSALRTDDPHRAKQVNESSILSLVQSTFQKAGQNRMENRKILQLMPDVEKAARLMTASTLSPNDLVEAEIPVVFDSEDLKDPYLSRINEVATKFFQSKLNLQTSIAKWVYEWAYESGACVFAIIPQKSFAQIHDDSYLGQESLQSTVIKPIVENTVFGFTSLDRTNRQYNKEISAMESYTLDETVSSLDLKNRPTGSDTNELIRKIIGVESLTLTDNPSILQVGNDVKERQSKRVVNKLDDMYRRDTVKGKANPAPRFIPPIEQGVVSVSSRTDNEMAVTGNPILMRLPPESVTVIHTPGDPSDHQGYFVLLDIHGNPISADHQEGSERDSRVTNTARDNASVFDQAFSAYGFKPGGSQTVSENMKRALYSKIVTEHLRRRMADAGFTNVAFENVDSVMRCMFSRFMEQKHTRVLFLPKQLVSYATFEFDDNGYGVSRLERVKFSLGLQMSLNISRILAAIKAATDRRKLDITLTKDFYESPEQLIKNVLREYTAKNTFTFSTDPNSIQTQIVDKSVAVKVSGIPGLESLDITNEPDQRSSSVDIDPSLDESLRKTIMNGLKVPASTMNSLSEDEFARSITTTNLFFAMEVAGDQRMTISCVSDLLRKYARYSEEFQNRIKQVVPSLKSDTQAAKDHDLEDDASDRKHDDTIPDYYTIDKLIDCMTIALPKPSIAPSKAQFEALDAMIQSITNVVTALFPDDLAGADDTLSSTIRTLRSKFVTMNIRAYLDSSGMTSINVPEANLGSVLGDLGRLTEQLQNVHRMLEDKAKLAEASAASPSDDFSSDTDTPPDSEDTSKSDDEGSFSEY